LIPVYLSALGFDAFHIGAITTAMLLGSAVMTLAMGLSRTGSKRTDCWLAPRY